jgi:putative tricarboxylic transport membrane protein
MSEEAKRPHKGGGLTFKVRGPREFYGGLALIALAIIALWSSGDLPGMHGFAFGPGTAPRIFATLLAGLGALVALGGLLADGPPIERFAVRGPAWVILGILVFAFMIRGVNSVLPFVNIHIQTPAFGLIPSTFLAFIISIQGTTEMKWIESLIAAVAMTAFCVVLFVYVLQLPFQLWPYF